ncbi:oligosaccharide flippase family protein [Luteimonas sp. MJ246]|uniref:oligosaccharide flippase family protein n=1 Tax=Luteimonas sp. MJ174 TaxID=3129237 RepID=UPI0031BB0C3C
MNALVGQGANLARLLLVAAAAGPAIAGKYAIATVIVGGITILTEVGFRQQYISTPIESGERYIHHRLSVAWTLNLSLRFLVIGVVLLLIGGNHFLGLAADDTLFAALALAVAGSLAAASNPTLLKRERMGDFRPNTLCESGGQLLGLALVLALLPTHASLELLATSQLVAAAAQAFGSYVVAPRYKRAPVDASDLMKMVRDGRPFIVIALMTYATYSLDKLVLGWLLDTKTVGSYYMAQRLAEIPVFAFSAVVGRTALPAYLRADHAGTRAMLEMVRNYTRILFAVFIPGYVIAVTILYTQWWSFESLEWGSMRTLLSLLLIAAIFRLGCHLVSPAMIMRNDVAIDARFKVQEAALFVPALLIATWYFDAVGAAICAIGLYAISWWRRYLFVMRYNGPSPSCP